MTRTDTLGRTVYTIDEWQAEGRKRFGPDVNLWKFKCPACGHVQTRKDFLDMGMNAQCDRYLAFSCVGRFRLTDHLRKGFVVEFGELDRGAGCKFVGGGIANISPLVIEISKGEERPTFGFAD